MSAGEATPSPLNNWYTFLIDKTFPWIRDNPRWPCYKNTFRDVLPKLNSSLCVCFWKLHLVVRAVSLESCSVLDHVSCLPQKNNLDRTKRTSLTEDLVSCNGQDLQTAVAAFSIAYRKSSVKAPPPSNKPPPPFQEKKVNKPPSPPLIILL